MMYILLILLSIAQNNKEKLFENDDFSISYTITKNDTNTLIKGVMKYKSDQKPTVGTNIWTDCLNDDGSQNGTVSLEDGSFQLQLPKDCKEVSFFKYYHDKINLKIEL